MSPKYDFDEDPEAGGVGFDGTAQMAVAKMALGRTAEAQRYLAMLRLAQASALNATGQGMPAASRDRLSTGLGWFYNAQRHVGATSWYIFAELGYNPFTDVFLTQGAVEDWRLFEKNLRFLAGRGRAVGRWREAHKSFASCASRKDRFGEWVS